MADLEDLYMPTAPNNDELMARRRKAQPKLSHSAAPPSPEEQLFAQPPVDPLKVAAQQAATAQAEQAAQRLPSKSDQAGLDLLGMGATDLANAEGWFNLAGEQGPLQKRYNPMHEPVKRYARESLQNMSTGRDGAAEEQRAVYDRDRVVAEEMDREVGRIAAENLALDRAEQARNERQQQQIEAMRQAAMVHEKAVKSLLDAPEEDPGRTWKDMGAGRQFLFAITGGLLAMDKNEQEPNKYLLRAIDRDIEAQRQNFQRRRDVVEGARTGIAAQSDIFSSIMQQTGDERAASLIYKGARLEEGRARMVALAQKFGLKVLSAQQKQQLADIDQKINANKLEIDKLVMSNPEYFYSRGKRLTPLQEKMALAAHKGAVERAGVSTQQAGQTRIDWSKEMAKAEATGATGGMTPQGRRLIQQDLHRFDDKTNDAFQVLKTIRDIQQLYNETGDIPGKGFGTFHFGQGRVVAQQLKLMKDRFGHMRTGAAISEHEQETYDDLVDGGWSDEALLENLAVLERELTEKIKRHAASTNPQALSIYAKTNPDAMPVIESMVDALGGPDEGPLQLRPDEYEGEGEE